MAERGDIKIRGDKREEEEATEVWPAEEEEATLHGWEMTGRTSEEYIFKGKRHA
jgi:hypothetical protein